MAVTLGNKKMRALNLLKNTTGNRNPAIKHRRPYAPGAAVTFVARFMTARKGRVKAAYHEPLRGVWGGQ